MSIEKNIHNILLSMTVSKDIIIYLFSKIKTVESRSLLTKIHCIFITMHGFAFCTYHGFKFLSRFCNNYSFSNIPELGNNHQFKPKRMFIIIEYHNFL